MTSACDFPIAGSLPEIRREVKPLLQTSFDILVPPPALPSLQSETAHEELTALFEWVGLACLGSQRSAPANWILIFSTRHYVGFTSRTAQVLILRPTTLPRGPPLDTSPISVGLDFFHPYSWIPFSNKFSGMFCRIVTRQVIIHRSILRYDSLNLAAITAVTFDGPVSYISSSGATQGGESAWSLVASQQGAEINWILAETSQ